MSYFSKNKLYEYYQISEQKFGSGSEERDVIEILNNESILFDFSGFTLSGGSGRILNGGEVELTKIHIDWGDGEIDRLSKRLISNKSTIGTQRPDQWKTISHHFNVSKRYEYKTDDKKFLHKIEITFFNNLDDRFVITIPYKILYKTLYDIGSEFSLFSANTTNSDKVSYTLKQKNSDSLFVVNSLDWRQIYGDGEIETIEQTVSETFSNDFVNEDLMVWDWNTPPTITITPTTDSSNQTITCKFVNVGIELESWTPNMELIKDGGNKKVQVEKILDKQGNPTYSYKAIRPNKTEENPNGDEFIAGVYKTYLNPMTGINGVTSESDICYFNYWSDSKPRQLRMQSGQTVPISKDSDDNPTELEFKYTMPSVHQVAALTKANLILQAVYNDEKYEFNGENVYDGKFTFDLLKNLYESDYAPKFTKKDFSYVIKLKDLPEQVLVDKDEYVSVKYVPSIVTNDVLGGADNTNFYDELGETIVDFKDISFSYDMGSFSEGLNVSNQSSENKNKNLEVTWTYIPNDDWEQFQYILTDEGGNIVVNDTHYYNSSNGKFNGLTYSEDDNNQTLYLFTKVVDGNRLPDGNLTHEVLYKVPMGNYYDTRINSIKKEQEFIYKKPVITVTDVQPYIEIVYDRLTGKQSLRLSHKVYGYCADSLSDITLNINSSKNVVLNELEYSNRGVDEKVENTTYTIRGRNRDDVYERTSTSAAATLANSAKNSDLLKMHNNSVDYLQATADDMFTMGDEVVDFLWVKQNTLDDIIKSKTYEINGVTYYGNDYSGEFDFNGSSRATLFKVVELKLGNQYIRRFMPVIFENGTAIPTAKDLQPLSHFITNTKVAINSGYDSANDKGTLNVKWTPINDFRDSLVKNAWLELYKSDTVLQRVSIKGLKQYKFTNLDFDNYDVKFIIDSEQVKNSSEGSNEYKVLGNDVYVNLEDTIQHVGSPVLKETDGDEVYITWSWKLYHTSCTDVEFCYKPDTLGSVQTFKYVESQNHCQSIKIPKTNGSARNKVTYWFNITSPYIKDNKNELCEELHKKTITL